MTKVHCEYITENSPSNSSCSSAPCSTNQRKRRQTSRRRSLVGNGGEAKRTRVTSRRRPYSKLSSSKPVLTLNIDADLLRSKYSRRPIRSNQESSPSEWTRLGGRSGESRSPELGPGLPIYDPPTTSDVLLIRKQSILEKLAVPVLLSGREEPSPRYMTRRRETGQKHIAQQ